MIKNLTLLLFVWRFTGAPDSHMLIKTQLSLGVNLQMSFMKSDQRTYECFRLIWVVFKVFWKQARAQMA